MGGKIEIILTEDEAWVMYEFLRRFSDTDKLSIEDQAEQRVLWDLCCVFERTLNQVEGISYHEFIQKCRDRLHDEE